MDNYLPNKTFLFNLSTSMIISRLKNRKIKNKYDKLDKKFHDRVNTGYKIISNNRRFVKIDASQSIQSIHKTIIKHVNSLL